jgi:hypothetical protein
LFAEPPQATPRNIIKTVVTRNSKFLQTPKKPVRDSSTMKM